MKIYTRLEFLWDTSAQKYVRVCEESYELPDASPVALLKGASGQQTSLANSQQAFYDTMTKDYSQQFANQTAVLNAVNASVQPVIAAGPNQYGFSPAETNVLNSQAIQGTAQQYNQAQKALQQRQAAEGGGTQFLPSGVNEQQKAELAATGANQTSSELLGIQQAGYTQGANQYQSAVQQAEGAAGIYNPTGYSGAATGAGNAAANEANTVAQENNAASPWPMIGGILGGVAGSIAGPIGAQVGSKIGSSIGGVASGATNSDSLSSWGL